MKKAFPIALTLLFTLGGGMAAQADGMGRGMGMQRGMDHCGGMKGHHGAYRDNHFRYMAEQLNLTKDQQEKARTIFDNSRKKMRSLFDKHRDLSKEMASLDPTSRDYDRKARKIAREKGELTEKIAIARAETRKQFHMLLTPEQRAKAETIMKDRQKMRDDRMKMREDRMKMRDDMRGSGRGMPM